MALVAGNVRIGVTGALYKAPIGSTAPTDASTALNAAYVDLGYISEDGVSESWDDSVDDVVAWQGATVVRSATTESSCSLACTLIETNGRVLEAFHRGSEVLEPSAGVFSIAVKPIVSDPSMWVLHVVDGTKLIRIRVDNGEIVERGELMYQNGEPVGYPITIRCYPDASGNLMTKYSNDVAWSAS